MESKSKPISKEVNLNKKNGSENLLIMKCQEKRFVILKNMIQNIMENKLKVEFII